jgi:antitoxin component HigA of HigAB toxin-antitoxin module
MTNDLKPIRSEGDYQAALAEVERLWGAKSGTPEGDRLDIVATLVDAYEKTRTHGPSRRHRSDRVSYGAAGVI